MLTAIIKNRRLLGALGIFICPVLCSLTCGAQAIFTVNGARVNLNGAVYMSTNDVSVKTGGELNVNTSTIKIAGTIDRVGVFDVTRGTVETNGSTEQVIPVNAFTGNTILNFVVSNNTRFNGTDSITGTLGFNASNKTLYPQGYVTLKSTATTTARLVDITNNGTISGNNISGNLIVERYIPAKRAFRFLTTPVNSPFSIKYNWMEGVSNPDPNTNYNPLPGYGTHITGTGNGFDATNTSNRSLYSYNNTTQVWEGISNTNGSFTAGSAYRLLVRGSRSTNLLSNTPSASSTTLRATGQVVMNTLILRKPGGGGSAGMPVLSAAFTGFSLIGNPYACPVEWKLLDKTDIANTFYVFDPTLNGTNGRGAYVSFNASIGPGVVSNLASNINNNIQSGQAFFVQTIGANPSLTFKEVYKSSEHRAVFKTTLKMPRLQLQLLLPEQLTQGGSADGLSAYFSNDYSSSLTEEDSYKLTNQDENIAILREGKVLSIEGRKPITGDDTLPLKMWQFNQKAYYFKIILADFENNVECYLEDDFLKKKTKLYNDNTTLVPFEVTADTASANMGRFRIVFRLASTLPVQFTAVRAYPVAKGAQVEWSAAADGQVQKFEVERSADGTHFNGAGYVEAGNNAAATYSWLDEDPFAGTTYYRIRSVTTTGEVKYSQVVRVSINNGTGRIFLAGNTVTSNTISVVFNNATKGKYVISLVNSAGQRVYSGTVQYSGGYYKHSVRMNIMPGTGIYQLNVAGDAKQQTFPVFFSCVL